MDDGDNLIGLRVDVVHAGKELLKASKKLASAEKEAASAQTRSVKAINKGSSNTTTAVPSPDVPHVFLASFRSSLLNLKGRSAVLDKSGHVRILPPAPEDPLSRTVRTLVGDGALLGQVHPVGNALLSSLPATCVFDNALVRGERIESKTRSMALF
jgi:hypothetical protein